MTTQKQSEQSPGTLRMRAFSLDVKIFNILLITSYISFPKWEGTQPVTPYAVRNFSGPHGKGIP